MLMFSPLNTLLPWKETPFQFRVHEKQPWWWSGPLFLWWIAFLKLQVFGWQKLHFLPSLIFNLCFSHPGIKGKLKMLTGWNRLDECSRCFTPCLCYFILEFLLILQQILMEVSNVSEIYVDYRTNTRDTHYIILKKSSSRNTQIPPPLHC